MNGNLSESLFKGVHEYLSSFFAKNSISQAFRLELKNFTEDMQAVDLVFLDGPLCGKSISFLNGRFQFVGKDLAVLNDDNLPTDKEQLRFLIEDSYALCAEALLRGDYSVFDPLVTARQRCWWYIQNRVIPKTIEYVSDGYLPLTALDSAWIDYMEMNYDLHINLGDGYYCNKLEIKEDCVVYFYNFPEPQAVGWALYGAVTVDKRTSIAQYYNLEMSFDDDWFISWQRLRKKRTMGVTQSRNRSDFLHWILNRI